jgi:steroid delta-isomerase-like uncharacterized protein
MAEIVHSKNFQEASMSTQNKLILRRFFEEVFNQGNLAVVDELVAEGFVSHNPAPGETQGREGVKQFVAGLRMAFRDLNFTIDDQVAEGDKVVTRWRATGTHQGDFAGVPPTSKAVMVTAINVHRVSDGKIQESWLNWDALGLLQQLGVVPTP